ncbi:MAG: DUF72 domain-containing protein [Promethearchaeota archaeon]
MEKKILIGTSGWTYDEWIGSFYPKNLKKKFFLSYYSNIFYTNEINTTFYNIPSKKVVENWVKKTPKNFLFAAKLPKKITHENKLDIDYCMDDLNVFLKAMSPLINSNKLLAFLIQLPPSFRKDLHLNTLKEFINNWPEERGKKSYQLVIEFRHKSWIIDNIFEYLKKNSLTYCIVIEPLLPPRMDITNPELIYMRFHGYGKKIWFDYCFSEEEIKKWAKKVKEIVNKAKIISIYFNNHFSGYAAKNSLMLMKELALKPRIPPKMINILNIKKKAGIISKDQQSLDKFMK